jgi:hypothetical protein
VSSISLTTGSSSLLMPPVSRLPTLTP